MITYTNENTLKMLVLSDLHFEKSRIADFEPIFNSFLKALSSFLVKNKEWTPQCLVLAGDIAHPQNDTTEYDEIQHLIGQLKSATNSSLHVIAVPGNHDKQLSKPSLSNEEKAQLKKAAKTEKKELKEKLKEKAAKRTGESDLEAAASFLEKYTSKKDQDKKEISAYLKKYFGLYANFISQYHKEECWHPVPTLKATDKLNSISGYYLIESPKICFAALNTEWKYAYGAKKRESNFTVGKEVIKLMEKHMKFLRRNGYTIISLMHRSPYLLSWEDMYGGGLNENSPVERIIGMSDLIICGHEHNSKNKEPDMLMNKTLLYQNGILFDRSPNDGRSPYSASLIRINPDTRMLNVVHFRFNTGNALGCEWIISTDAMRTYSMDALVMSRPRQCVFKNELYKEIALALPVDTNMLHKSILSLFYQGCTQDTIPAHIKCLLMELDMSAMEKIGKEIEKIRQTETGNEPFAHTHVILYTKQEGGDMDEKEMNSTISLYKEIKNNIRSEEIEHKLVTNLVICNVF